MNTDNIDKLVEHFLAQIELTETDIKEYEEKIKTSKQHLRKLKQILKQRIKYIAENENDDDIE